MGVLSCRKKSFQGIQRTSLSPGSLLTGTGLLQLWDSLILKNGSYCWVLLIFVSGLAQFSDHVAIFQAVMLISSNWWKVERIWGYFWFSYTEHQCLPPSKLLSSEYCPLSLETPNVLSPTTGYCFLPRKWLGESIKWAPLLSSGSYSYYPTCWFSDLSIPLSPQTPTLRPQTACGLAHSPHLLSSSVSVSWHLPAPCCGYW